jgi:hypothetical protein
MLGGVTRTWLAYRVGSLGRIKGLLLGRRDALISA